MLPGGLFLRLGASADDSVQVNRHKTEELRGIFSVYFVCVDAVGIPVVPRANHWKFLFLSKSKQSESFSEDTEKRASRCCPIRHPDNGSGQSFYGLL